MTLEVVNLGLPKSGTTTLARALQEAGYKVADHRLKDKEEDRPGKRRIFVANLLYRGLYEHDDPMALLPDYSAISEMSFIHGNHSVWPQCDFTMLRALKARYPALKFIATRRDAAAHSASIMRWNNLGTTRLPNNPVPGLPVGYGKTTGEQIRWINSHHDALRHWFRDDPDFLEIDVADDDAQNRVATFLGREMPWWGKANVNRKAQA